MPMTTGEKMIWAAAFVSHVGPNNDAARIAAIEVRAARKALANTTDGSAPLSDEDLAMLREMVGEDVDRMAAVRVHVESPTFATKGMVRADYEDFAVWLTKLREMVGARP